MPAIIDRLAPHAEGAAGVPGPSPASEPQEENYGALATVQESALGPFETSGLGPKMPGYGATPEVIDGEAKAAPLTRMQIFVAVSSQNNLL
jgi:hypothetical protein